MPDLYTYSYRGEKQTAAFSLEWGPNGASLPYDEGLHGEEAWDVWIDWLNHHGVVDAHDGSVSIYWSVCTRGPNGRGKPEAAPFAHRRQDWLTHYSWPRDRHGAPLRWTDLPVEDGKSVWITDLIGWRPAPFTPFMPVRAIALACGLRAPDPDPDYSATRA
jgi:hypothetical protein